MIWVGKPDIVEENDTTVEMDLDELQKGCERLRKIADEEGWITKVIEFGNPSRIEFKYKDGGFVGDARIIKILTGEEK